ncbi:hypothetical protein EDEG_02689 [Edhazardia aedis USNM 41457]|uniref:Uncharacterized protein n=1 Tax=Edhazardia aedis (strain USNM 41457) TaxID=1003232 RepID=J9D5V3_EDHAE|nr:hypothetical protein EDEG_02689 [Edhazardia aedis USNM 41457]|eukprot:EJW02924.1 hypothetical protein EDEG_02689 [Edhazardia aedis USNM 41457]
MENTTESCTNCGGITLFKDESNGQVLCTGCGHITTTFSPTASLEFNDNMLAGRMINLNSTQNLFNTVNKVEQLLMNICDLNYLPLQYATTAFRYYKLSSNFKLTKGKSILYSLVACLYLVCRLEKCMVLLVDLSCRMRIDCFYCAKMFLKIRDKLCVKIGVVDPSFYLEKYVDCLIDLSIKNGFVFSDNENVSLVENEFDEDLVDFNLFDYLSKIKQSDKDNESLENSENTDEKYKVCSDNSMDLSKNAENNNYLANFDENVVKSSNIPNYYDKSCDSGNVFNNFKVILDESLKICEKVGSFPTFDVCQDNNKHHNTNIVAPFLFGTEELTKSPGSSFDDARVRFPVEPSFLFENLEAINNINLEEIINSVNNQNDKNNIFTEKTNIVDKSSKTNTNKITEKNEKKVFVTKKQFKREMLTYSSRIVKWMKRDWIITGRRPNNVCGAAILLASRILYKKYSYTVVNVINSDANANKNGACSSLYNLSSKDSSTNNRLDLFESVYSIKLNNHDLNGIINQNSCTEIGSNNRQVLESNQKDIYITDNSHNQNLKNCKITVPFCEAYYNIISNNIPDNKSIFTEVNRVDDNIKSTVPLFTLNDVSCIVKGAPITIEKRLKEIDDTKTAKMTVEEFMEKWVNTDEDPPVIKNRRKKELRRLMRQEKRKNKMIEAMCKRRDSNYLKKNLLSQNCDENDINSMRNLENRGPFYFEENMCFNEDDSRNTEANRIVHPDSFSNVNSLLNCVNKDFFDTPMTPDNLPTDIYDNKNDNFVSNEINNIEIITSNDAKVNINSNSINNIDSYGKNKKSISTMTPNQLNTINQLTTNINTKNIIGMTPDYSSSLNKPTNYLSQQLPHFISTPSDISKNTQPNILNIQDPFYDIDFSTDSEIEEIILNESDSLRKKEIWYEMYSDYLNDKQQKKNDSKSVSDTRKKKNKIIVKDKKKTTKLNQEAVNKFFGF